MSIYDTIDIDASLLPAAAGDGLALPMPEGQWQTHDLDECMQHYRLGPDGVLQCEMRAEIVPPPGGWADLDDAQGGWLSSLRHLPRNERIGFASTTITAEITAGNRVADPRPHPQVPAARRWWHVDVRLRIVDGRLVGPIALVAVEGLWSEPAPGGGWRSLELDPVQRARRDEQDRLCHVLSAVHERRAMARERIRRLLAGQVPPRVLAQVMALVQTGREEPIRHRIPRGRARDAHPRTRDRWTVWLDGIGHPTRIVDDDVQYCVRPSTWPHETGPPAHG